MSETRMLNLAIIRSNKAYDHWSEKANLSNYLSVILYELLQHQKITQKELIKMSDMPKQSINKGIHILQEKGYISLAVSKEDNRVKICELTTAGRQYALKKMRPLVELENKTAQKLGKEKMKELATLMTEWSDIFWKLMNERE